MPVILDEKDRQHFSSEVCLRYDTTDPAEVAKLQALDFKSQKIGHYPAYGRCLAMNGTMFIKPPNLPYDQRFQKSLPIEIKVRHQKRETDMVNIVSNIALLPATLSADTVGSVVMTPAWIKAGMDYFMKDVRKPRQRSLKAENRKTAPRAVFRRLGGEPLNTRCYSRTWA